MWSPTHVLVTVHRARGLLTKGKHGTNDAFVTISLGKEKYQTSVKEKAAKDVDWHEECELPIPKQGNTAEIILTALHRNFLGVDEFLGAVHIPLADFDVYERPKCKWYELKGKPGKEKNKQRGDLEVKVTFKVKAGSLTDLSKKERSKSSLGQLSHMAHSVGGSLLSIGSLEKRKGLKNIARTIGNKMGKHRKDKDKDELQASSDTVLPNSRRVGQIAGDADPGVISEDEDEFTFDDLSHKSSQGSLSALHTNTTPVVGSLENLAGGEFLRRTSVAVAPPKPARVPPPEKPVDEWEQKLYGKQGKDSVVNNMDTLKRRSWDSPKTLLSSQPEEEEPTENNVSGSNQLLRTETPVQPTAAPRRNTEDLSKSVTRVTEKSEEKEKEKEKEMSKLARKFKQFRKGDKHQDIISDRPHVDERIIIGGEDDNLGSMVNLATSKIPSQFLQKYDCNAKEELIAVIYNMQKVIDNQSKKMKDLEDYLDNLLLRVMETTPRILQNPYVSAHFDGSSRSNLYKMPCLKEEKSQQ